MCYDAAVTFQQSSECLFSPPTEPVLTRQRGSSIRGSRHGSHSSTDSRKKSKTSSPTRSPTRSISQQRNTPIRSESFKDNQKELTGPHVYGGSDATSTFGSRSTPVSEVPTGYSATDGTVVLAVSQPGQYTGPPEPPSVVSVGQYPQVGGTAHTGANHMSYEQGTPTSAGYGSHSYAPSGSQTPVVGGGGVLAQLYESPGPPGVHTPGPPGVHTPSQKAMFAPSPSPVPAGLHSLSQAPVYAGSQSSMCSGSQMPALSGSQSLSMYGATGGSQTPPPSMLQNNTYQYNTLTSTAALSNSNQQYHQLAEVHTPIATSHTHMDPAVAAESTPL